MTKDQAEQWEKELKDVYIDILDFVYEEDAIKYLKAFIKKTRADDKEKHAKLVEDWVKEDTKMPEYMKNAIQGLLTAIAKSIRTLK